MSSATFPESPASTTGYSTADFALNWHQFGPSLHYPQNRRPPLLCPLRDVDQCLPFLGHIGARAAVERVVAGAAVYGDLDQCGQTVAGREGVVAAVGIQDQVLGGADVQGEGAGG